MYWLINWTCTIWWKKCQARGRPGWKNLRLRTEEEAASSSRICAEVTHFYLNGLRRENNITTTCKKCKIVKLLRWNKRWTPTTCVFRHSIQEFEFEFIFLRKHCLRLSWTYRTSPASFYNNTLQSSAVITRFNLSRYYIRHYDNGDKKLIRFLESQQIPHISPSRGSYGVSVVRIFRENWSCFKGTALYMWMKSVKHYNKKLCMIYEPTHIYIQILYVIFLCQSSMGPSPW